jgi:4-hydroxy-L-threonine phosphate dehydrogenase PdxA
MTDTIKVGISHGDINGISYEVIMKTLLDPRIMEMCTPIIYGSPKVAAYHRKALNINNLSLKPRTHTQRGRTGPCPCAQLHRRQHPGGAGQIHTRCR